MPISFFVDNYPCWPFTLLTSFFLNISELKIPHKLHSQNDLNLFRIGTGTARNAQQWWKTLSATGVKLTTLRSTMANDEPDSGFMAFSVPWWLVGTIKLSPDLFGPVTIFMIRCDPDQALGFFRPRPNRPNSKAYNTTLLCLVINYSLVDYLHWQHLTLMTFKLFASSIFWLATCLLC